MEYNQIQDYIATNRILVIDHGKIEYYKLLFATKHIISS